MAPPFGRSCVWTKVSRGCWACRALDCTHPRQDRRELAKEVVKESEVGLRDADRSSQDLVLVAEGDNAEVLAGPAAADRRVILQTGHRIAGLTPARGDPSWWAQRTGESTSIMLTAGKTLPMRRPGSPKDLDMTPRETAFSYKSQAATSDAAGWPLVNVRHHNHQWWWRKRRPQYHREMDGSGNDRLHRRR